MSGKAEIQEMSNSTHHFNPDKNPPVRKQMNWYAKWNSSQDLPPAKVAKPNPSVIIPHQNSFDSVKSVGSPPIESYLSSSQPTSSGFLFQRQRSISVDENIFT